MPSFKRTAQFFLILLIITLVDFLYLGRPSIGIDDANIFMNYQIYSGRFAYFCPVKSNSIC